MMEKIEKVKLGEKGRIRIKLNSITSYKMVDKLYQASEAGVIIQMIGLSNLRFKAKLSIGYQLIYNQA